MQLVKEHLPQTAHIISVTDYKGNWIFGIEDPNDEFDNFKAVNKLTGNITRFNPWEDDMERFATEAFKQNSK